jgi:hypothetical protein
MCIVNVLCELQVQYYIFNLFILVIVNDDQQDATIWVYLFILSQLYVFRAMSWPIIRSM